MQQSTNRPDNFDVNIVIKELQQTTDTLDQAIGKLYPGYDSAILTDEDNLAIKAAVYSCIRCGFWNERSDMSEEFELCNECKENESSYQ